MSKEVLYSKIWEGKKLEFRYGNLALQADGSILVNLGDTYVLVTTVYNKNPQISDFLPLTIDFRENYYSSGKIGGPIYQKREGKPSDYAILNARLIDRSIRPVFPKIINDIVISITPLSFDKENSPAVPGVIGASLATILAGIPFEPVSAVRIGYIDDFIINPTYEQLKKSKFDLVVAGTKNYITMIEFQGNQIQTDFLLKALEIAFREIKKICNYQEEFINAIKIKNAELTYYYPSEDLLILTKQICNSELESLMFKNKHNFWKTYEDIEKKVLDTLKENFEETLVKIAFYEVVKNYIRDRTFEGIRQDGRKDDDIRELKGNIGFLPNVHGLGLFQRGETQVISILTLGAPGDAQLLDTMEHDEEYKRFMHHYNMPGFSTAEAKPSKGISRREIGHGRLVEKALEPLIPSEDIFPYTIRIVSEVLSSSGSTSMASVCASSLALMDGGVPIESHVGGIAMGLIYKEGKYKILSDIQSIEDFFGDMDFKIAGTKKGITALQLDVKIKTLNLDILEKGINKGYEKYNEIIDFLNNIINKPNKISINAPRIISIKLTPSQIRDVIGPGGATIQEIIKQTQVKIDFKDDGTTIITAKNDNLAKEAINLIQQACRQPQVGDIVDGIITRVENYGIFVKFGKNKIGLCHISNLGEGIFDPRIYFKEGDQIKVKIIKIDEDGKIQLKREF